MDRRRYPRRERRALLEVLDKRELLAADAAVAFETIDDPTLIGERVRAEVSFSNPSGDGSQVGFGPYVDLIVPASGVDGDDGLSYVSGSAELLDSSLQETVLEFGSDGRVQHPFALNQDGTPLFLESAPGDQLVVLTLPIGSYVGDQPSLALNFEFDIDSRADVGVVHEVKATAGYRYGEDALDNPEFDPMIRGGTEVLEVTPEVLIVDVDYLGPEDETAVGPNFEQTYRVTVDVAEGVELTDLNLSGLLDENQVFTSLVSEDLWDTITTPDSGTISEETLVSLVQSSIVGKAGIDASFELSFFVSPEDVHGDDTVSPIVGNHVISEFYIQTETDWTPVDERDDGQSVSSGFQLAHELEDQAVAVQSSVRIQEDNSASGLNPDDILEYTLDFQVADHVLIDGLTLTSVIPDGQDFLGMSDVRLSLYGVDGVEIANVPFVSTSSGIMSPSLPGAKDVVFDIADELAARGYSSTIAGGETAGGLGQAVFGKITFRTQVNDVFARDFPSGDASVDEGDVFYAPATIAAQMVEQEAREATGYTTKDDSGAGVRLPIGSLATEVYAINGEVDYGEPVVSAADEVTLRIRRVVRSSDIERLVISDYLPMPILTADSLSFVENGSMSVGQVQLGPNDSFHALYGKKPDVTFDTGRNMLELDYGDFDSTENETTTIDLLVTVKVVDNPFADGLWLTSHANTIQGSTNNGNFSLNALANVLYTRPFIELAKGFVDSSNSSAAFSGNRAPTGITFGAPGSDTAFTGTFSSGGNAADANVANIDAGDLVRVALTAENVGLSDEGAFELQLVDQIPDGFRIPASGLNLRVQDGSGADLAFSGISFDGDDAIFNGGIEVDYNLAGAGSDSGASFVIVTYDLEAIESIQVGQRSSGEAEVLKYTAIQGGENYVTSDIVDDATVTVALPRVTHSLISTDQDHTSGRDVVIGENASYRVQVTVPEGTSSNTRLTIQMPRGLGIEDLLSVSWSDSLQFSNTPEEVLANAVISNIGSNVRDQARVLTLDLGDMVNNDSNNAIGEMVTVEYTATTTNDVSNVQGRSRSASATFTHALGSNKANASSLRIREANLAVKHNFSSATVDADDLVQVTVDIVHSGSKADAFDLTFNEELPGEWEYVDGSLAVEGADDSAFSIVDGIINGQMEELPLGKSVRLTFDIVVDDAVSAGSKIDSSGTVKWSSLAGEPGRLNERHELAYERTGNTSDPGGSANDYRGTGVGTLQVAVPELKIELINTSETFTSGGNLAIGETATYEVHVQIPEGQHELELALDAPFGDNIVSIESLNLVSIGEHLTIDNTDLSLLDSDNDGSYADRGIASLGTVVNRADNSETAADTLVYLMTVRLVDQLPNAEGERSEIGGELDFGNGVIQADSDIRFSEAGVVTTIKPIANVDALDASDVTIVFSHDPSLGSDPQAIRFTGSPASSGLELINGSVVVSGGQITAGNSEGDTEFGFEIPELKEGESVEMTLRLQTSESILPGDVLRILGTTEWATIDDEHGRVYIDNVEGRIAVNSSGISGWVFVDENQDGERANIDTGLVGTVVTLTGLDHLGNEIERQTNVSPAGYYAFEGLRPGAYEVAQGINTDFDAGNNYVGTFGGELGEDRINAIVVASGTNEMGTDYNFTEAPYTWISGTVYFDQNENGLLGTGEEGIAGVTIELTGLADTGEEIERTVVTNERGYYMFNTLPSGTYSIRETQPEGYFDAAEELGTGSGTIGEDEFTGIRADVGTPGEFYHFGEYEPASIEGQVYIDYDRDFVRDRKDGHIAEVYVALTGVNDLGEVIEMETTTDIDGLYHFAGLRPGDYEIRSEAIEGLDAGATNVGLFLGAANARAVNGTGIEYGFEAIRLPAGGIGEAYDIGHLDPTFFDSQLVDGFDRELIFKGTDTADQFVLQFGTAGATVTVNGTDHEITSEQTVAIRVLGSFGNDSVYVTGSTLKEEFSIRDTSAALHGTWFSGFFYGIENLDFAGGGNEDLVRFYDTIGDEHLTARPFEAEWEGDGFRHSVSEIHRIYAFSEEGGTDSANLTGSVGRDNFVAAPDASRMYNKDYYIGLEYFEKIVANATDDGDRAYLHGLAEGVDRLAGSASTVSMTGESYSFVTNEFAYVLANGGTGGEDSAELIGSSASDTLNSGTTESTFDTQGTRMIAKGFEELDVYGKGGHDSAFMNDSHYNDVFQADALAATMTTPVSRTTAYEFERVDAYALAGGEDVTRVEGGSGRDTFKGWAERWELRGSGVALTGYGFTQVIATANSSNDRAYLYDSSMNDTLEMWANAAILRGESFENQAIGFRRVVAEAQSGGFDRAVFNDGDLRSTVRYNGERLTIFGSGYSNNAKGFDVVDALYETLNGNDRVELSGDLQLELIAEDISELYRLSMSAGSDGNDDSLRDRINAIPVSET